MNKVTPSLVSVDRQEDSPLGLAITVAAFTAATVGAATGPAATGRAANGTP